MAFWRKAKVRGLWSVKIMKVLVSTMCLKCLIALEIAKSSLSKALYLGSADLIFLEKKPRGCHPSLVRCCRAAPIAKSDASVKIANGASGSGYASRALDEMLSSHFAKSLNFNSSLGIRRDRKV